jgi:hypothetical protein
LGIKEVSLLGREQANKEGEVPHCLTLPVEWDFEMIPHSCAASLNLSQTDRSQLVTGLTAYTWKEPIKGK